MKKLIILSLISLFCFGVVKAEESPADGWKTVHMKEAYTEEPSFMSFEMPSSSIALIAPQLPRLLGFHGGENPSYLFAIMEMIDAEEKETFATKVVEFIDEIKMSTAGVVIISSTDTVTSQGYQAHDIEFTLPDGHALRHRKCRLVALPSNNVYMLCTFSDDGQDQHQRFIDSFRTEAACE